MFKKLYHLFRVPSYLVLAQQELDDARRELLEAQTAADYSLQIVEYNRNRIARLVNVLKTAGVTNP